MIERFTRNKNTEENPSESRGGVETDQHNIDGMAPFIPAFLIALPNSLIIWAVIIYTVIGITGENVSPVIHLITLAGGFLLVYGWSIYGSRTAADVVYQSCRLGMLLALLLPVVTLLVSTLWGLQLTPRAAFIFEKWSLIEIPAIATSLAMLLILLYLAGSYLAARHIKGVPF